ncbi:MULTISPECIES: hypothetical protein [unclassified Aureispira]|uniref:DUF7935 family protein n=1 Tax=unclassified Aureispira TaxID=2649989 RepID=UPI000696DECF|nr:MULTISPECIES: hypothetical protein [unclassified Aureispira]WMX16667.1 hypothetical protein QP953_09835 [Aureispira sp. CCB-E]
MEATIEILKLLLPSLFVFLTAWLVLRAFLNRETDVVQGLLARDAENRRVDLLKTTNETLLPMRLQAYERMTLFCSRMEIGQLVTNTDATPNMTAEMYKTALVLQVEEEFNHNITQQVYMTDDLWNIILLAKKEVTQICQKIYNDLMNEHQNKGQEGVPSAKDFLDALVAYLQQNPQIGYIQALGAIKKEVGVLFN